MASFYEEMAGLATELLTEFDQGGLSLDVYSKLDGGNSWEPEQVEYAPEPFNGTVKGVSAHHLQDSLIQSSDLIVTMDGKRTPKMQDRITIDGKQHTIIKIEAKPAAGVVAAYAVFVRA